MGLAGSWGHRAPAREASRVLYGAIDPESAMLASGGRGAASDPVAAGLALCGGVQTEDSEVGVTRRLRTLLGLAVLLVAACGSGSTSSTPASSVPFNVLAIAAVSGANGASGLAFLQGMKAAAIVVNQGGGILGHKIDITTQDPQGSATTAVSMLDQSLNSPPSGGGTWNFCQCGGTSDENLAENPVAGKAKLISITQAAAAALNA